MEGHGQTTVLFGEAEKGEYRKGYYCQNLPELVEYLGNPPPESRGLFYAIQTLLYHRPLIFFRVREEGFSAPDYLAGLSLLEKQSVSNIAAIFIPGVGDTQIIHAATPICLIYHSILVITEADVYDYLSSL